MPFDETNARIGRGGEAAVEPVAACVSVDAQTADHDEQRDQTDGNDRSAGHSTAGDDLLARARHRFLETGYRPGPLTRGCAALSLGEDPVTTHRPPAPASYHVRVFAAALAALALAAGVHGRTSEDSLRSRALDGTLPFTVYLPAGLLELPAPVSGHLLPPRPARLAVRLPRDRVHHLRPRRPRAARDRDRAARAHATATAIRSTSTGARAGTGRRRSPRSCRGTSTLTTGRSAIAAAARWSGCPRAGTAPCCSRSTTSTTSP